MEKVFEIILEKYQPEHIKSAPLLIEYMSEEQFTFLGIVEGKKGDKQVIDTCTLSWTDHEYVNQTINGGYSGDEYAGFTYVPISDGLYLHFSYWM